MIESELFGYEKASVYRRRWFKVRQVKAANSGTLFLDEIGELEPNIHVKLLKVVEEKVITRVGADNSRAVNLKQLAP